MLLAGHPDAKGKPQVNLDRESLARIIDWLDVNAVYYGDHSWNKPEWRGLLPPGERALREHIRHRFGPDLARQPFAALVNVALLEESRILKAPLAARAGGWGLFPGREWRDTKDLDYQRMRQLVEGSIAPGQHEDIAGLVAAKTAVFLTVSGFAGRTRGQCQGINRFTKVKPTSRLLTDSGVEWRCRQSSLVPEAVPRDIHIVIA